MLDLFHDTVIIICQEAPGPLDHVQHIFPGLRLFQLLLHRTADHQKLKQRRIILHPFQLHTDERTVDVDILLLREPGVFPDEASLTVLQNVLRQAFQGLLLYHPFNDLLDKG